MFLRSVTLSALGNDSKILDGVKLDTVAAGGSREILVEHAGKHTITARHENVNGEWTLQDVYLDRGRAFGWTVSE